MVLITALVTGGVALTAATFSYYQNLKTKRAAEETKQAIEETKQTALAVEAAKTSEAIAAGATPGLVDDFIVLGKKLLPYALIGAGLFITYKSMGRKRR